MSLLQYTFIAIIAFDLSNPHLVQRYGLYVGHILKNMMHHDYAIPSKNINIEALYAVRNFLLRDDLL